ncbi:MAG: primosomal protein N', partial [Comamonas sp.]|nr:primosomal protein N' [Candidatus Comamonas equi]
MASAGSDGQPGLSPTPHIVHVAVHTPVHSGVGAPLSYTHSTPLPPGTLVRVSLGTRHLLGVVWAAQPDQAPLPAHAKLRAIDAVMGGLPALDAQWQRLVGFAARYYQRSVGEIAMAGLPPALRDITAEQLAKRLAPPKPKKLSKKEAAAAAA